jgi:hypothetical protein
LAVTNQVIEGNTSSNEISYISVRKINYLDLFDLKKDTFQKVFVYHKSFDRGFIALCGFGICPFKHVLVNNWANGWVIPQDSLLTEKDILVIFWPNLLSLLGFFGFSLTLILVQKALKTSIKPIAIDKK